MGELLKDMNSSPVCSEELEDELFASRCEVLREKGAQSRAILFQQVDDVLGILDNTVKEIRSSIHQEVETKSVAFNELMSQILQVDKSSRKGLLDHLEVCFCNGHWVEPIINRKLFTEIDDRLKRIVELKFNDRKIKRIASQFELNLPNESAETAKSTGTTLATNDISDPFLVTVNFIRDPGEFYVVRKCDEQRRNAVFATLKTCADTLPVPEEVDVKTGKMYAVLNCGKVWCRGICGHQCGHAHNGDDTTETLYEFFLLDQGHYESIPSSSIRVLSKELIAHPPLALECSLNKTFPIATKVWNARETTLFKQLTKCRVLDMKVFAQQGGVLDVDLAQVPSFADEGNIVSIRDALFFTHPNEARAVEPVLQPASQQTSSSTIAVGSELSGVVTCVHNASVIYVQTEPQDGKNQCLLQELQSQYSNTDTEFTMNVYSPVRDQVYAALFKSTWYRVVVDEVRADGMFHTYYLDTGHMLTTDGKELRTLPEKYLSIPPQVIRCKLDGLKPTNDNFLKRYSLAWSKESTNFLQRYVLKPVTMLVMASFNTQSCRRRLKELALAVIMFDEDSPTSINSMLTKRGLCFNMKRPNPSIHQRSILPSNSCHQKPAESSNGVTPSANAPRMEQHSDPSQTSEPKNAVGQDARPDNSSTTPTSDQMEMLPSRLMKPEDFTDIKTCSVEKDQKEDEKMPCESAAEISLLLEDAIATHSSNSEDICNVSGTLPRDEISMDVTFVHCNSPDSMFFRTRNNIKVYRDLMERLDSFYSDYQPKKRLQFEVNFACVVKDHGEYYRAEVIDIDDYPRCKVLCMDIGRIVDVDVDSIFPLLVPFDEVPRLAINCSLHGIYPIGGVWDMYVQKRITELLMTATDITICKRAPLVSSTPLSTMVVYTVMCEGGPLELPGPKKINLNEQLIELKLALDRPDPVKAARMWKQCPVVKILPQFNAVVTWVNLAGEIYLYDINKSEAQLSTMRNQLTSIYEDSQPTDADLNCKPGDMCIARYILDGCWYRATVTATGLDNNKVEVFFVDYGTRDEAERDDIRLNVMLEDIPIQTIKCHIHNIKVPGVSETGEETEWPIKTLDCLHTFIVDQRCRVNVHVQSPLSVSLCLPSGVGVGKWLVDKKLAEFIQGKSKSDKGKKRK